MSTLNVSCWLPCIMVCIACAAGGDEPMSLTSVRVDLRTDYVAGLEFTTVRSLVDGRAPVNRSVSFGESFADWARVASFDSARGRVRVELIDADGGIVASREAELTTGRTSIRIAVLRCERCACTGASDCPALSDCSIAGCERGACVYQADHDSCSSGVCDPTTGCSSTIPDADDDGIPATEDCDDGDAAVGRSATRSCDDMCGTGIETCSSGVWSECDVVCACEPGSIVTDTCGNCGTRVDTCGSDGMFMTGACIGEGVCAAGEIEQGDSCGTCGTLQRSCSATCGWLEFQCVEPVEGCWLWNWSVSGWTAFRRPSAAIGDAPTLPVVAAFDVEASGEAYLVTASTYHVMRVADRTWVASGALSALLPGFTGTAQNALTIAADHPAPTPDGTEGLQISTMSQTFVFDHVVGTRSWTSAGDPIPCCGPAWTGSDSPTFGSVRAAWLDADDQHGWFETDPATLCMAAMGRTYDVPAVSYLEGRDVHLLEAGACFVFAPQRDANTFGAFGDPGGPDPTDVRAAFYRETEQEFWVVTP